MRLYRLFLTQSVFPLLLTVDKHESNQIDLRNYIVK